MNKQELIKKIKNLPFVLLSERYISQNYVLELLEQLDEPQSIKLKDVIARIKGFKVGTRKIWIDEILNELGSDYGVLKYKAGYEQGKLEGEWVGNQLKDADKIRQELNKPVIPQFVADWYEENKGAFEANLYRYVYNIPSVFDGAKLNEFDKWFLTAGTKPFQTLVNMHQFGYEVEKEKLYRVKFKGFNPSYIILKYQPYDKTWFLGGEQEYDFFRTKHTRKELEEANFGWVFDCPGIEVEEVE